MNVRLSILIVLFVFLYSSLVPAYPCFGQHFFRDSSSLLAKNGKGASHKEDSRQETSAAIEEYEKEKLAKIKKNIGNRLLTVKTVNPAEFFESPDDLERKVRIKREKEGFVITKVVQNQLGTMDFYQVKFDTGQIGYLSADGDYLEIKIKEGSLISVPKRSRTKKKGLSQSKAVSSQAVELVKNHLTPAGSVEKRMMDEKLRSFPNLKWRYEAKEIGSNKYRVTQYAREGIGPPLIRTWIVDLSTTTEIKPENLAAKEMYR
jgi:hypothetical protein